MINAFIIGFIMFNMTFIMSQEFRYNLLTALVRLRLKLQQMIDEENK